MRAPAKRLNDDATPRQFAKDGGLVWLRSRRERRQMIKKSLKADWRTGSIAGFGEFFRNHFPAPQGPIFHYTTAHGLQQIVTTGKLIATDARFFNDASELDHGWQFCVQTWRESFQNRQREVGGKRLFERIVALLEIDQAPPRSLAACFSAKEDDLSQWRAYGDGSGYCLGFAPSTLEKAKVGTEGMLLGKVIYRDEEKRDLLLRLFDAANAVLRSRRAMRRTDVATSVGKAFAHVAYAFTVRTYFWRLRPWLKHSAFEAEAEYRLVHFYEPDKQEAVAVEYRSSRGALAPYTLVELSHGKPLELVSVRCGPTTTSHTAAADGVKLFLKSRGVRAEVQTSGVPLRF